MNHYLILCRSLTYAQRSKRLLEQYGISSAIVKAPLCISEGGCGYALSLHRNFDNAIFILKNNSMLRGKVYKENKDVYEEMLI